MIYTVRKYQYISLLVVQLLYKLQNEFVSRLYFGKVGYDFLRVENLFSVYSSIGQVCSKQFLILRKIVLVLYMPNINYFFYILILILILILVLVLILFILIFINNWFITKILNNVC